MGTKLFHVFFIVFAWAPQLPYVFTGIIRNLQFWVWGRDSPICPGLGQRQPNLSGPGAETTQSVSQCVWVWGRDSPVCLGLGLRQPSLSGSGAETTQSVWVWGTRKLAQPKRCKKQTKPTACFHFAIQSHVYFPHEDLLILCFSSSILGCMQHYKC
jgi:hypothetical protein